MSEVAPTSGADHTLAERVRERWPEAVLAVSEPTAAEASVELRPDALRRVATGLRDEQEFGLDMLMLITGVDRPSVDRASVDRASVDRASVDRPNLGEIWVVHHLESSGTMSSRAPRRLVLKCRLPRTQPSVASVADIWPAADWHERETYDLLGVVFVGHPNLRRILLPEDWDGHPLRRDYEFPREYHGIPCSREYAEARGIPLPMAEPFRFDV